MANVSKAVMTACPSVRPSVTRVCVAGLTLRTVVLPVRADDSNNNDDREILALISRQNRSYVQWATHAIK